SVMKSSGQASAPFVASVLGGTALTIAGVVSALRATDVDLLVRIGVMAWGFPIGAAALFRRHRYPRLPQRLQPSFLLVGIYLPASALTLSTMMAVALLAGGHTRAEQPTVRYEARE